MVAGGAPTCSAASVGVLTEEENCAPEHIDSLVRPLVESAEQTPPPEPEISPPSQEMADCNKLADALEQDARIVLDAITPRSQVANADDLLRASEFQAQMVLDSIHKQLEAEREGITVILSSFTGRPATALLDAPQEVLTAPAPPSLEWARTPPPVLVPALPPDATLASVTAGPQTLTLNGPYLPSHLKNLTGSRRAQQSASAKRGSLPTWMLSLLIATALLLGGVSLVQYLNADRGESRPAAASAQPSSHSAASAAPSGAVEEHPASRFVEVAGVRITNGLNHRPQLQYIVINHSSKELTGLGIRLALRSGSDANSAPILTVSSKVPALGAYQSREIRTELDGDWRTSSLPDWQSLRTDVQVSNQ